jgi:2-methylisocitrate lyase-like PEP mutase family enzyme
MSRSLRQQHPKSIIHDYNADMSHPPDDLLRRCQVFRELHEAGCFVIPNPWDRGSAHLLVQLGFKALATTSSGFAWSLGKSDNHVRLEETLEHFRTIASSVNVPVSADFEHGFAADADRVGVNVAKVATTGVAGVSIEDSTGDPADPLFAFDLAVERIKATHAAIAASGTPLVLTARSEGFLVGRPDLDATIRRLVAYANAGADCVYAPGIRDRAAISAVVSSVAPVPVNVLVGSDYTTVAELAALGVRRISVGGALALAAWTGFMRAAQTLKSEGSFAGLANLVPYPEINGLFAQER